MMEPMSLPKSRHKNMDKHVDRRMDQRAQRSPPRTLRSDARQALAVDLGWQARLAARQISIELDAGLAACGLSSAQFALMCLIAASPDDTLGGLAERAGLNQSTMSRNVDLLVGAGLVEVAMVIGDRRRRAVWLTETGALRLVEAMRLWRPAHRALTAKLGPKLCRQFADTSALLSSSASA
jgi:DNA-binding MarR family transcriptional regulator